MNFRFTLSHEVLGSLEINQPDGWKDAVLKLERDKNFHSLIEYFDGSFIFYGSNGEINGGVDFIRQVELQYGFDADLSILIEITFDGFTYENVFSGLLKLDAIQERENNTIQVPIVRNDFWSKFINRMETPVNLQSETALDGESINQYNSTNIILPSQKIQKTTLYEGVFDGPTDPESLGTPELDASGASDGPYNLYSQIALDLVQKEINDSFSYVQTLEDTDIVEFNLLEMISEGGELSLNVSETFLGPRFIGYLSETSAESDPSKLTSITIGANLVLYKNGVLMSIIDGDTAVDSGPFTEPIVGFPPEVYVFSTQLSFAGSYVMDTEPGDLISLYFVHRITFGVDVGTDIGNRQWEIRDFYIDYLFSNVRFTLQSEYRQTAADSFLLHDAGGHITDRIIGQNSSFYSEFLGSDQTIYRQYNQDGCGWKNVLVKGLQLRKYSLLEKPFFISFKQWWDGGNPILNLGLGYETDVDGDEIIRVEEKEHFYNTDVSLNISNVRSIRRAYDPERVFKTVKIGYKQWQSESFSGIDDPQTKHTYASRLQKSGTDITLESDFIAASLAIETTRRTTREKSADYKFDNETFIIAINPIPLDTSPETSPAEPDFIPELDENFDSVTNLLNSETRYNLRLTPARNLIRWLNFLSGCLQSYLGSTFKFTAGEGNYDMQSDMSNVSDGCDEFKLPLSESQDIPVSDDYLHLALAFEITIPMEWEDYKTIRDNRKKAIGISQTDENHIPFFIKELNYEIAKGQATITAWPVELMEIVIPETIPALIDCVPNLTAPLTVDNDVITVDNIEITVDQTEYTI